MTKGTRGPLILVKPGREPERAEVTRMKKVLVYADRQGEWRATVPDGLAEAPNRGKTNIRRAWFAYWMEITGGREAISMTESDGKAWLVFMEVEHGFGPVVRGDAMELREAVEKGVLVPAKYGEYPDKYGIKHDASEAIPGVYVGAEWVESEEEL